MIKITFLLLIILHGMIHLSDFFKAFNVVRLNKLNQSISRFNGILWLTSGAVFMVTALLLLLKRDWWWMPAIPGMVISQYLIITSWQGAKFGTIANIIILLGLVLRYGTWNFSNKYRTDAKMELNHVSGIPDTLLTEADILHLPVPGPVKNYFIYVGVLGKNKVRNFTTRFDGQFRKNEASGWMKFNSKQYNFIYTSTRFFFMTAKMKGIPVSAYHSYENGNTSMDIRLLSLFNKEYLSGKEMTIGETVTYLNDLCVMTPASLIDSRIKWEEIDSSKVKAVFTNNNITISAWLIFNKKGELINFISEDRYYAAGDISLKKVRWSTPVSNYKEINGIRMPT